MDTILICAPVLLKCPFIVKVVTQRLHSMTTDKVKATPGRYACA